MGLKTVLVHVDDAASCEARFEVALRLSSAHGAHLVGLYVDRLYALEWNALTVENVISHENEEEGKRVREVLQERAFKVGMNLEWRSIKVKDELEVGLHARYADLMIVGQPEPSAHLYTSPDFPAALTLAVARPVLIIPYNYRVAPLGVNILVAWNRSREATRAVTDALLLLERAQKVTVLVIGDTEGPLAAGDEPGADIALNLARHGVNVEVQYDKAQDDDRAVGDRILSRALESGADLIVMGAYGHWRVREFLVGGVTRSLVRQSRLPVLMSH